MHSKLGTSAGSELGLALSIHPRVSYRDVKSRSCPDLLAQDLPLNRTPCGFGGTLWCEEDSADHCRRLVPAILLSTASPAPA